MILCTFLIGPKNPIRGCSLVPDGLAQLWLIVLRVSRPEQLLHTDCSAAERSQAQITHAELAHQRASQRYTPQISGCRMGNQP